MKEGNTSTESKLDNLKKYIKQRQKRLNNHYEMAVESNYLSVAENYKMASDELGKVLEVFPEEENS